MKKIRHQLFNNLSIELSSSSEIHNTIQDGRVVFKRNPTVGLPEVSKQIESAIRKRLGDQRKHSFLEKKDTTEKGKWIHYEHSEMDRAKKQPTHHFHKIFFHITKFLACNAEKTLQLKITEEK